MGQLCTHCRRPRLERARCEVCGTSDVVIYYTRAWEGPLHDLCYARWAAFAQDWPTVVMPLAPNHTAALARAWGAAGRRRERYVVLTEADFLPEPDAPVRALELLGDCAFLAPAYVTRDPSNPRAPLVPHPVYGAYWILLDKERCPARMDFGGSDPGHNLGNYLLPGVRMNGEDGPWPGITYPGIGWHAFWSRHWNDPPEATVGNVRIGDVQAAVGEILKGGKWNRK